MSAKTGKPVGRPLGEFMAFAMSLGVEAGSETHLRERIYRAGGIERLKRLDPEAARLLVKLVRGTGLSGTGRRKR